MRAHITTDLVQVALTNSIFFPMAPNALAMHSMEPVICTSLKHGDKRGLKASQYDNHVTSCDVDDAIGQHLA